MASEWEPIYSRGRLVYWRRWLPDGGWLAVTKHGRAWRWAHRLPHGLPGNGGTVRCEGYRSTSRLARTAADRAVADPNNPPPQT